MEKGKTYTAFGKTVKVVGVFRNQITGTREAHVVWAVNGATPKRGCDRFIFEGEWKWWTEV
jgi:hypothetical protein